MTPQEEAGVINDLNSHAGFKLLVDKLEKKSGLKRTAWLSAKTPEEAEIIRQDSRVYALLMGIINEFLLRGRDAQRRSTDGVQ